MVIALAACSPAKPVIFTVEVPVIVEKAAEITREVPRTIEVTRLVPEIVEVKRLVEVTKVVGKQVGEVAGTSMPPSNGEYAKLGEEYFADGYYLITEAVEDPAEPIFPD